MKQTPHCLLTQRPSSRGTFFSLLLSTDFDSDSIFFLVDTMQSRTGIIFNYAPQSNIYAPFNMYVRYH